ncbi:MAG: hypothetical protein JWN33_448 [Candidatus Saccharibacteria bacterium]|nr:hypothetical protein [Candidatus Saccharibacteria bacterium]
MKRPKKITRQSHVFNLPCEKKTAYKTEADAVAAADHRMLENMSVDLEVYQCNVCNQWHLTRAKKK